MILWDNIKQLGRAEITESGPEEWKELLLYHLFNEYLGIA